jgi:hypothetical protein
LIENMLENINMYNNLIINTSIQLNVHVLHVFKLSNFNNELQVINQFQ